MQKRFDDPNQLKLYVVRGQLYAQGEIRLTWREIAKSSSCPIAPNSTETDRRYPSSDRSVRNGWGIAPVPRAFTGKQARLLKEGGAVLESLGRENIRFVTLTLSGSTREAMEALEAYNAYAANLFNQYLRRHLNPAIYEYCWEYQARGALHLHYAIYVPKGLEHKFTEDAIRDVWRAILIKISFKSQTDLFAIEGGGTWRYVPHMPRVDVQVCNKSVGGYMAKYTKRARMTSKRAHGPAQWSNVSKALRQLIEQHRQSVTVTVSTKEEAIELIEKATSRVFAAKTAPIVHPVTREQIGRVFWNSAESGREQFGTVEKILKTAPNAIENRRRKVVVTLKARNGGIKRGLQDPKKGVQVVQRLRRSDRVSDDAPRKVDADRRSHI